MDDAACCAAGASPSRRALLGGVLLGAAGLLAGCARPGAGGSAPATGASSTGASAGSTTAAGVTATPTPSATPTPAPSATAGARGVLSSADLAAIAARYEGRTPTDFGLEVPGVVLRSDARPVVLTLDACGGPGGEGVDTDLLDLLRAEQVPATLFLNARWIEANRALVDRLAGEELFELANHGTRHRPLSVTGQEAYGINGTAGVSEAIDEVYANHRLMTEATGRAPRFFRPGTAYFDDVAVELVRELGEVPVNFDVNGDAGATFTVAQVASAVGTVRPGSIIIGHMNRPDGATAEGLATALPQLRRAGHTFAQLGQVGLT